MTTTLDKPVSDLLGCTYSIVLAGTAGRPRSEFAAVAQAGGFGPLGMVREPEALIRSEVEARRGGGIERFGVNLTPAATVGQHKNRNLRKSYIISSTHRFLI